MLQTPSMTRLQEELAEELEALEAVYFDEVKLLHRWPPSLSLTLSPLTCSDPTAQFVTATLLIEADTQYPLSRPTLRIVDSKGLGDQRQCSLLTR